MGGLSSELVCILRPEPSWTVLALKTELERVEGTPRRAARLLVGSQVLRNSDVLADVLDLDGDDPFGHPAEAEVLLLRASTDWVELLERVERGKIELEDLDEDLRRDHDIVLAAVSLDGIVLKNVVDELKRDREIVTAAVRENGAALAFAHPCFQADAEVVLAACQQNGLALQHAADVVRSDRATVLNAVQQAPKALIFAAESLRRDHSFALEAVRLNSQVFQYLPVRLQQDREVLLAAVKDFPLALHLEAISEGGRLFKDRKFILEVVHINGCAIAYAAEALRKDPVVLEVACEQDPTALACARGWF